MCLCVCVCVCVCLCFCVSVGFSVCMCVIQFKYYVNTVDCLSVGRFRPLSVSPQFKRPFITL